MPVQHKIRRSWQVVPASDSARVTTAAQAGADVVVLDLAEFVAEQDKPSAREGIAAALDVVKAGGAEVFVQIDPELMLADLRAAIWPGIAGVVISRLESATQIVAADTLIGQLDQLLPGSKASEGCCPAPLRSCPLKQPGATTMVSRSLPPAAVFAPSRSDAPTW